MASSTQDPAELSTALLALQALLPYQTADRAQILVQAIGTFQGLLRQRALPAMLPPLGQSPAATPQADGLLGPPDECPAPLLAWGALLRASREGAGMTRAQLAKRAGIAESSIKFVETGRHAPGRRVMEALLMVPELMLDAGHPFVAHVLGRAAGQDDRGDLTPTWWLTHGFDPIRMVSELSLQLNGLGGHIDQMYLYLDPLSAAAWCALSAQDATTQVTAQTLDSAAARVLCLVGRAGLDVIGLGPGEAQAEVALVQSLLRGADAPALRLYLLDTSQPLLNHGYTRACSALSRRRKVPVFAVQGSFHDLPRFTQLLYTPERAHRRRVLCLFGWTFGNLSQELLFLRNSLVGFAPGDLLLLDVALAAAPADLPAEVRRRDPLLSSALSAAWHEHLEEWLIGLVRRHVPGIKAIALSRRQSGAACTVPGSYTIEIGAELRLAGGVERYFSLLYMKRYEETPLFCRIKEEGWEPVAGWRYGEDPRLLALFRRCPVC